jgi:hypothetical protein
MVMQAIITTAWAMRLLKTGGDVALELAVMCRSVVSCHFQSEARLIHCNLYWFWLCSSSYALVNIFSAIIQLSSASKHNGNNLITTPMFETQKRWNHAIAIYISMPQQEVLEQHIHHTRHSTCIPYQRLENRKKSTPPPTYEGWNKSPPTYENGFFTPSTC